MTSSYIFFGRPLITSGDASETLTVRNPGVRNAVVELTGRAYFEAKGQIYFSSYSARPEKASSSPISVYGLRMSNSGRWLFANAQASIIRAPALLLKQRAT